MISREMVVAQLPFVLDDTNFEFLGKRYEGKVRDNYTRGDLRYIITTDRLSCFDRVLTTVPFKGQALNEMAIYWFKKSESIIRNHLIEAPDPNVVVVKNCNVLPVEVVMRGYLAGSAWRDYAAGNAVSGIKLPPGMRQAQKLPLPVLTPSTKAERGVHDEPISEEEILKRGIVDAKLWAEVREVAFALFELGQREAAKKGLILVDTKYEFGLSEGKLTLVDEVHTMDCSRYWIAADYKGRFDRGENQEMLDKEPTRQWLLSQGFKGDGPIPTFTLEHRCELAEHYLRAFKLISGRELTLQVGSVSDRIHAVLAGR